MSDIILENNNETYLEGIISVAAAITSKKRCVHEVFIDKSKHEKRDRKIVHLISQLKKEGIPYSLCPRSDIDSIADSSTHGGVIARVGEYVYTQLNQMITDIKSQKFAVMLDGVEDPYNFGYSIRNLFAFGCNNFFVPERNWMSASNIVATSSAGSSELCNISVVNDDTEFVSLLKQSNIDIVCSALSSSSVSLFQLRPQKPFVLFIGGEKRGISKTFMENADHIVHIPYTNPDAKYSLPTASCAAIYGSHLSSI